MTAREAEMAYRAAEQRTVELQAERRAMPERMTAAAMSGDSGALAAVYARWEELPGEIFRAQCEQATAKARALEAERADLQAAGGDPARITYLTEQMTQTRIELMNHVRNFCGR